MDKNRKIYFGQCNHHRTPLTIVSIVLSIVSIVLYIVSIRLPVVFTRLPICHIEEYNEAENVSFINQDFRCFLTSRGLKIVHQNIKFVGKINKVRLLVADSKQQIGIFSITETHLNDTVKNLELKIPGYTIERRNRINGPHGGVICYIRDDLTHQRRSDLEIEGIECIWIQSSQRDPRDRARAGRHAGKSICQRDLSRRQCVFYRITSRWQNK